ncbi:hypothetical protein IGX57_004450 [Escherichia coli]|nr:hypothetical protein [Escherichia coli]
MALQIKKAQKELKPANDIYFSIMNGSRPKNINEAIATILDAGGEFDKSVDKILEGLSCEISEMMSK